MKKLLLILFIPFVSFSQTYEELMSIESEDMFKKFVIENGYEYDYKQTLINPSREYCVM